MRTTERMGGLAPMLRARQMVALGLLAVTVVAVWGQSPVLAQAPDELAVPDAAAVALDASTTAFLAVDFLQSTCAPNPICVATLPAVADGLKAARTAKAFVVYSVHP